MGLRDIFRRDSKADAALTEAEKDVAQYYEIGEFTEEDCDGCTVCYPKSLNIEDGPLFNSAPKVHGQVLVATGQTNWLKNIGDENTSWGNVCKALGDKGDDLEEHIGGLVRVNGTDMEFDDAEAAGKVAVIVLPQFLRINTDPEHCFEDVKRAFSIKPNDKLPENMIPVTDRGLILLCSHKTRDKRCGITAPLLKKTLEIELRHEDLYRDFDDDERGGVRVVMCNHVGGHKFAANALIYQNNGMALMLARLRPDHAKAIVQKTILNNIVVPENVRSCNKLDAYSW